MSTELDPEDPIICPDGVAESIAFTSSRVAVALHTAKAINKDSGICARRILDGPAGQCIVRHLCDLRTEAPRLAP